MMKKLIKVLVVDDSTMIRELLTNILNSDETIEVVGGATDPYDARNKIKQLKPDVITLDIEMPRMDGLTFLANLMRLRPMPVVMISTLTEKGADVTLKALELGAVDYIAKPKTDINTNLLELSEQITRTVKSAAESNISAIERNTNKPMAQQPSSLIKDRQRNHKVKIIAIGASTGGTEATKDVLRNLPDNMPPILITQHMPAGFTASYARRLDSQCQLTVVEFDGRAQALRDNHVYLANGAFHMQVSRCNGGYQLESNNGEPVNRHKPSVDVLFNSIATTCGRKSIGIILTGMGSDGARGLAMMRDNGAHTIAQDKSSSVVWGMPRIATEQNAAIEVLPPPQISKRLINLCYH